MRMPLCLGAESTQYQLKEIRRMLHTQITHIMPAPSENIQHIM